MVDKPSTTWPCLQKRQRTHKDGSSFPSLNRLIIYSPPHAIILKFNGKVRCVRPRVTTAHGESRTYGHLIKSYLDSVLATARSLNSSTAAVQAAE